MRALVIGAALVAAVLGAAAPVAHAQYVAPPVVVVPVVPVGYGYFPSPLGLYGSIPSYGSTGAPSSSICTDPQTGQQTVIPTANVFAGIASSCVLAGPGQ